MKRFFILTALLAVLGLASCKKDAVSPILGTWEATTAEMNMGGIKMEIDVEEMGLNMVFTFKEDGTGTLNEASGTDAVSLDFNYTYSDNLLTLDAEGEITTLPVTIDGKKMTMVMDGEMLEEENVSITIYLTKK